MKKKEIVPFTTTWLELKDITVSEINSIEKYKYCVTSLINGI